MTLKRRIVKVEEALHAQRKAAYEPVFLAALARLSPEDNVAFGGYDWPALERVCAWGGAHVPLYPDEVSDWLDAVNRNALPVPKAPVGTAEGLDRAAGDWRAVAALPDCPEPSAARYAAAWCACYALVAREVGEAE